MSHIIMKTHQDTEAHDLPKTTTIDCNRARPKCINRRVICSSQELPKTHAISRLMRLLDTSTDFDAHEEHILVSKSETYESGCVTICRLFSSAFTNGGSSADVP